MRHFLFLSFASLFLTISAFGSAGDSSSMTDFEKSLMAEPSSEMNQVYRIRDALLESVKSKDTAGVSHHMDELDAYKSATMMPVQNIEKECIYIDAKMYGPLLKMLVRMYKNAYDSSEYKNDVQFAKDDGLMIYIKDDLSKLDASKNIYYTISADIDNSNLSQAEKEELAILLLLTDAYSDKNVQKQVVERSENFISKYPENPDAPWIQKCILDPLKRMKVSHLYLAERKANKENVIADKLYTGGFGLNVFLLGGGFALGFDDYFRNDIFEPDPPPFGLEFYFQIFRFSVSLELTESGLDGVGTYGLGLGFVAYDSRYLKVRPYFEIGASAMGVKTPRYCVYQGESYYAGETTTSDISDVNTYTLGANLDFKFITAYFLFSDKKLTSFSVVGKFGISYMDIDDNFAKGKGVDGFVNLGLGIYFW